MDSYIEDIKEEIQRIDAILGDLTLEDISYEEYYRELYCDKQEYLHQINMIRIEI